MPEPKELEASPEKKDESFQVENEANGNDDGDDDDDDDDEAPTTNNKKKKKRKKKKKKGAVAVGSVREPTLKPPARGLLETAFTDYYVKYGQTDPPTTPVADLFRDKELPVGEIQAYNSQTYRETSAEVRARDRLHDDLYSRMRTAAEVASLIVHGPLVSIQDTIH